VSSQLLVAATGSDDVTKSEPPTPAQKSAGVAVQDTLVSPSPPSWLKCHAAEPPAGSLDPSTSSEPTPPTATHAVAEVHEIET